MYGSVIRYISIFLGLGSSLVSSSETLTLQPRTKDDYGSGATLHTEWYSPGGCGPRVGMFIGHPNVLPRGDRGLVRYDLSAYLLPPVREVPIREASLTFRVESVHGSEKTRRIEVSHLKYDALALSGNDLVNGNVEVMGVVDVSRDSAPGQTHSLDVTRYIMDDLWKGNRYSAFRFRDIDAEARGNPDLQPAGVIIYLNGTLPLLEIEETR